MTEVDERKREQKYIDMYKHRDKMSTSAIRDQVNRIRTENELIVRKGESNEYGQFMYFEPVTFVPIDLDALLPELMAPAEKELLNNYHKKVYDLIAPHLTSEEKIWLKHNTRTI